MPNLWIRKPLESLRGSADPARGLKPTLGAASLVTLGVGAIIGAGLFVRTPAAIADRAGPAVTLGFVVAALGCALAGLCYAELASMIPIAGSAYTYSYATLGELAAFVLGWDLVLEYAVGSATVAIAWSEYLNRVLGLLGWRVPYAFCHSPFEVLRDAGGHVLARGVMNLPAPLILVVMTAVLIRGTREAARLNGVIVATKVAIVALVIACGWAFINPANHTPYIPPATSYTDALGATHAYGGLWGILGAAGVVFFAFIGFDAVSTTAQEAKNPRRDMPVGILGSLAVCTLLYILFAHVLSGLASVADFRTQGREAAVAWAITHAMPGYGWLANLVTVAILAGFSSVVLVTLLGQSRVFFSMSEDGLVPAFFSELHPRFRTPWKSNLIFCGLTGLFAAFIPGEVVGEMTSIGTLFAFILVSLGVWVLRVRHPELPRSFRTPFVPLVPILAILVCALMIAGLGWPNQLRLLVWLALGLAVYFAYGVRHSKLNRPR